MIYLDNAATRPALREAAEAARLAPFFNPSSTHGGGKEAARALETARAQAAKAVGCLPGEIFFTSGGTESISTAVFGAAEKTKHISRRILSSSIEHAASLAALRELKRRGWQLELLKPKAGAITPEAVAAACEGTGFMSLLAVNNETGTVTDHVSCARALKRANPGALFHLDAVQAFLKTPISLEGVDLMSISGHKVGALPGVGILYIRNGLKIPSLVFGGGQERDFRGGTENLPAIVSLGAACEKGMADASHALMLREELKKGLDALLPGWTANTPENGSPFIFNFSLKKGRSEVIVRALSEKGIYISAGSACARGKSSHVISALGLPPAAAASALRVSFAEYNTAEEVRELCRALAEVSELFI